MKAVKVLISLIVTLALLPFMVAESAQPMPTYDPRTMNYVETYMKKVHSYCNKSQYNAGVQIKIEPIPQKPKPMRGYCRKHRGYREIVIDSSYWYNSKYSDRYEVLAHEMSHCVFNVPHTEDATDLMHAEERNMSKSQIDAEIDRIIKTQCQ